MLGVFGLVWRRLRGDMIAVFKYLKGCHREEGEELFDIATDTSSRNNGYKLQLPRVHLNIRKNLPDG